MTLKVNDEEESYLKDEKALKRFAKQLLKNYEFVGIYTEQRFVPDCNCYKKIVKISNCDNHFLESLNIVKFRIEKFYRNKEKWLGITLPNTTGAPVGHNLWVNMQEEIFGTYKFKVQTVQFSDKEITIKLQIVPENQFNISNANSVFERSLINNTFNNSKLLQDGNVDLPKKISWVDVKDAFVFICLLIATIITGGGKILTYMMDYTLKLLQELRLIIKTMTPIIIAVIETVNKSVGYLSFLIATLWRDRHGPVNHPQQIIYQHPPQKNYLEYQRFRALPPTRSSVKITPLD